MSHPGRSMVLLFSGGLDTTLEAVDRLSEFETVHLLTFNNGYCIHMSGARRRARELQQRYGADRLLHAEVDTAPLLRVLATELERLGGDARSPIAFDLACKMASMTELVHYARAKGIRHVSDGAAAEQTEIFLQDAEFLRHIQPFVEAHGLRFLHPVGYDKSRAEKLSRLREEGLDPGVRALERVFITSQLAHQPFCLRGIVTFFFTSPLRHLPVVKRRALSVEQAKALWDRLLPVAEGHLQARLDVLARVAGAQS